MYAVVASFHCTVESLWVSTLTSVFAVHEDTVIQVDPSKLRWRATVAAQVPDRESVNIRRGVTRTGLDDCEFAVKLPVEADMLFDSKERPSDGPHDRHDD